MNSQPVSCDEIKAITKKESAFILNQIKSKDIFLISRDGFNIITKDKVQNAVFIDCHEVFERLIKPVVISSAMESEVLSPGSGDLSLVFLLGLLRNYILRDINHNVEFLDGVEEISKNLSNQLHQSDINKIISNITDSKTVKTVINSAISLAGSENKIFVEPCVSEETTVELVRGYFFKRKISEETRCFFNKNRVWERKNSKVFIVDGDIISVSDIHFLLESLSSEKRSCLLIARSFSPDVLNTLHANFARGTLNIIPVDIPFEQDTANILVDIATACNTDIVSTLKGDLISKACKERLDTIKRVKIDDKGISIINPDSDRRCHALLLNLKNRIQNEKHFEIREILSRRVASLSGSKVMIRIGKKIVRENPSSVEDADKILRHIASATKFGVISNREVIRDVGNMFELSDIGFIFLEALKVFSPKKVMPAHSVAIAAKKGLSTFNIIKNTSHGLLVDNT